MINRSLKEVVEAIDKIERKLGFWKFVKYISFFLVTLALINYETVIRTSLNIVNSISNDIHNEKMQVRDQLLSELYHMLSTFRASVDADRVLYFEYHNSKENLVGIPFKYIDLILQDTKHGIPRAPEQLYKDINTGIITTLYEKVKHGEIAYSLGPNDSYFNNRFPGVYEFFNEKDNSHKMVFLSIPGISQPLGLIILEWVDTGEEKEIDIEKIIEVSRKNYIPRINGCILSKTSKW